MDKFELYSNCMQVSILLSVSIFKISHYYVGARWRLSNITTFLAWNLSFSLGKLTQILTACKNLLGSDKTAKLSTNALAVFFSVNIN